MLSSRIITPLFSALLISGCVWAESGKPEGEESFQIFVHHQSTNCGKLTESRWIADQQQYEATFQAMFQQLISGSKPQSKTIDFTKDAMLFISMGQQRTGGYSIKLGSDQMRVKDGRAVIELNWTTVKRGMVSTQMLTNPCLLLQVPRANYQVIDVLDQAGKLRQSIKVD